MPAFISTSFSCHSGRLLLLGWFTLVLLPSCVDEIKLNIPQAEQTQLVMVGTLSQGETPRVELAISRSGGFEPGAIPAPVAGAEVRLEDRGGNSWIVTDQGKGSYAADLTPASPLHTDTEYRLLVTLAEGQRYESGWSRLLPAPAADSLSYDLERRAEINDAGNTVDVRYIRYYVHTPLEAEGRRVSLKWDFSGCYLLREAPAIAPEVQKLCYVTENVNLAGVAVYNGLQSTAARLDRYLLFEQKLSFRYGEVYYLTAVQQAIPQEAARYWEQISEILGRSRGVFDAPPGSVRSNWRGIDTPKEVVEGFFFARSVDTVRIKVILPDGALPPAYCDPPAERAGICADCLRYPGSSLEKPDYWMD